MVQWGRENIDIICNLFKTQILENATQFLDKGVSTSGFYCLMQLFLQVNEKENRLNVTNNRNVTQFVGIVKQESKWHKVSFRVHVMP